MEVKNISWNEHTANKNNHPLLPKSLRYLIVGKSGCGKTTLLLNLLLRPGWLHYSQLSVFGKSLFQPEHKILRKGFEEQLTKDMIMNIFENRDEIPREQISPNELIHELAKNWKTRFKDPIECNFYESANDVPDPKEISPEHKNLIIFDDLLLQKQNKCEAYYVRGRHSNCDCLYLSHITSNCLIKQFEKMQISFVCFLKTRKILITLLTTTCLKTWRKNSSKSCVRLPCKSHTILLWLIWPRQRTMGNSDLDLTTFSS